MKIWYRVVVRKGHMGTRRNYTVSAYFFAKNTNEVLRRYKTMPGVKIKYGPEEVRILTKEQANRLESIIRSDWRISLNEAKKKWYYVNPMLESFILYCSRDLLSGP